MSQENRLKPFLAQGDVANQHGDRHHERGDDVTAEAIPGRILRTHFLRDDEWRSDNADIDIRFRRDIDRLYEMGPRSICELLDEIGNRFACRQVIVECAKQSASISDDALNVVDARDLASVPFREMRR